MKKNKINVGLIGFGTIGTGVVKLFQNSKDIIFRKTGIDLELKKICDIDIERDRGIKIDKNLLTTNANDILEDNDINIVIELIGGYEPALSFILKALNNKKHVVTANKALLSKYWDEVMNTANKNKCEIKAEASVGGGIPILLGINNGLTVNKILEIRGILNGTSNYILTKMTLDKMDFSSALKEAQKKGFAEADPTLDIEGYDALHKIVILSTLSFLKRIREEDVYVEGIKDINYMDISYAEELGYVMKLLAISKLENEEINVRVHPALLPKDNLLSSVNYEFNAIYIKGDAVGETMFYGKGAGEMPTASSVMADVIGIAKNIVNNVQINECDYNKNKEIKIKSINHIKSKYYIRFNVIDRAGVLAEIAGILGKHNISIESVIQKARNSHEKVPVVFMTYEANEENLKKAINEIDKLEIIKEKTVFFRVVE